VYLKFPLSGDQLLTPPPKSAQLKPLQHTLASIALRAQKVSSKVTASPAWVIAASFLLGPTKLRRRNSAESRLSVVNLQAGVEVQDTSHHNNTHFVLCGKTQTYFSWIDTWPIGGELIFIHLHDGSKDNVLLQLLRRAP
jgi:hypothetical protein